MKVGVDAVVAAAIKLAIVYRRELAAGFDPVADALPEILEREARHVYEAATALDLVTAEALNTDICRHTYWKMGLVEDPPPPLADPTLLDLAAASVVVAALDKENEEKARREALPGERVTVTIRTIAADRAVAALYTAYHYAPDSDPVAMTANRCVGVLPLEVPNDEA